MRSIALWKHSITSAAGLLVALSATEALAAPPQQGGPKQSSAQFTLRREEAGGSEGIAARNRARAGDCAGALPNFDTAIRNSIEPTLRRDRGLCHEKLGHPYPAIDDYRAYLTAKPDANDADQIRERLARLEEQTGQGGPSSRSVKEEGEGASGSAEASTSAGGGQASASVSLGGSASAGASGKHRHDEGGSSKDYDDYAAQEKVADSSETSPLRYGEGWVLGPILQVPRYFFLDGNTSDMAYVVGGRLGYSWSASAMFVLELGYGGTGKSGSASSTGGPVTMAGVELRIPISRYASDQILLGGGVGFERYVASASRIGVDLFAGRFKVAYRHVFGPSIALDLGADGGPAYFKPDSGAGDGKVGEFVGGSAAFLIAF